MIVFIYNIYHSDTVNKNIENNITNSDKIVLNMDDDFAQIITNTAKRNSDWTNLPLSESFKKKYNNRIGILGKDDDYTNLYGSNYMSNKEKQIVVLYVDHNYKQEEYYIHYTVNDNNELDDVAIIDKKLLYNENGEEVIYKKSISEENYENVLIKLADPYNINHYEVETNYFNLTNKYMEKWGGGFVNNRGYDYYSKHIINELSSFKDSIVYMQCVYPKFDDNGDIIELKDKDLTLFYKIRFFTNEDNWLDDIEVEEISKEEIDKLLEEKKVEIGQ